MTIDLPYKTWRLAEKLAQRLEWSLEDVLHQALEDATDLQDDIEMCECRDLEKLVDFVEQ